MQLVQCTFVSVGSKVLSTLPVRHTEWEPQGGIVSGGGSETNLQDEEDKLRLLKEQSTDSCQLWECFKVGDETLGAWSKKIQGMVMEFVGEHTRHF